MARKHVILQGFVDINLETDENINTKIVPKTNQVQSKIDANVSLKNISKSFTLSDVIELPVSFERVLEVIDVNFASVKLAHIKGSRVYGLDDSNSDWDLTIVTSDESFYIFKEINLEGHEFDIHLYSQSKFQEFLDDHSMREMETLHHPINVRLIDDVEFTTVIDNDKLIESVKAESDSLWNRAKNELNSDGANDDYISLKRIFHSFRILTFAEQILKNGSIIDFNSGNYLYEPIVNSKQNDFVFFETNFSVLRDNLKLGLNVYLESDNLDSIDFKV